MFRKISIVAALFLLLPVLRGVDLGDQAEKVPFRKFLKGEEVSLAKLKDRKMVALYFWTLNCPPCVEGFKEMNQLAKEFKKEDIEFIAVGCDDAEKIRKSGNLDKIEIKVAVDDSAVAVREFLRPQDKVPVLILIDKSGRLAWRGNIQLGKETICKMLAGQHDLADAVKRERFEKRLTAELSERKYEKALIVLHEFIGAYPDDMGLVLLQANLMAGKLKKEKKALEVLDSALKKYPANYSLYDCKLNILLTKAEENNAAIEETYRKIALSFAGKDRELLVYLGRQLLNRSDYNLPHAYILLSAALKQPDLKETDKVKALQGMGYIYYRAGKFDRALNSLDGAIKLNKDENLAVRLKMDRNIYIRTQSFAEKL